MSLKKQFLKSRSVCKVTFRLPREIVSHANSVALVGDFNGWSEGACWMNKLKSGEYTCLLELAKGRSYQFRYLIDGKKWINDPEADDYVKNAFGSQNSVAEIR